MADKKHVLEPYTKEDVDLLFQGRFTQDSPILPEVWLLYLANPGVVMDLLLTPHRDTTSGVLLKKLCARAEQFPVGVRDETISGPRKDPNKSSNDPFARLNRWAEQRSEGGPWVEDEPTRRYRFSVNDSSVVTALRFDEMIRLTIPLTTWWRHAWRNVLKKGKSTPTAQDIKRALVQAFGPDGAKAATDVPLTEEFVRFAWVVGHIVERAYIWSNRALPPAKARVSPGNRNYPVSEETLAANALKVLPDVPLPGDSESIEERPLFLVNRNRNVDGSVFRSTGAIKADAAKRLFQIDCSPLRWAIIDSGIDAEHPAFGQRTLTGALKNEAEFQKAQIEFEAEQRKALEEQRPAPSAPVRRPMQELSRVQETYDFTRLRGLMDPDLDSMNAEDIDFDPTLEELREIRALKRLLRSGRAIEWGRYRNLLTIRHDASYRPPEHQHGTHVAGILASDWRADDPARPPDGQALVGVCPDINLVDLRVLDAGGRGTEFTVMAALQFIRYLNSNKDQPIIHGVNLSLSTPHDVVNYACGRTPVCDECERLVGSGVVVVAAAGNSGYRKSVPNVSVEGYHESTITDPGNCEAVITVGSTHRFMPHAYGVSYFSSRGPTGDGRYKPDLLAPGEKIRAPIPGVEAETLDGTSMAAPHVSGAAAMLMARHTEFIGRPAQVKEILCKTATNLGRDRYYQGFGIVDVLRALQSV